jgi:serine/threonine protein kinase
MKGRIFSHIVRRTFLSLFPTAYSLLPSFAMNTPMLGQRYEIQQQLGKKAGRQTLLARDTLNQELVVVKLLSFGNDFEWDDLKLFEREAETLKTLSHPCIPRYLDYFEVTTPTIKGFALVQTYIQAQTLEQCLKSGRNFTELEVKDIASSILDILIYLHQLYPSVIHRDIKPSNILLKDRTGNSVGQVYLVDFGSVQTVTAESGTRTVVGTYGYMPPEQFGGRTTAASDLYSLGATLIYLVTGIHPADLPQKDLQIQFEDSVNLSPSFTNWLRSMTQPSLDKRFQSATQALQALQEPLTNLLSTTPTKPVGSRIQLIKNWDFLEIRIPPQGFKSPMLFSVFFAIAWNSMIFSWTIGVTSGGFPASIPFVLFSLPFWIAGSSMVYRIVVTSFNRIILGIDKEQIKFTNQLFWWKFKRWRSAPRESITKLVYIPRHFTKESDGSKFSIPAQLVVWAGVEKYELGGDKGIIRSESELEWLAQELSEWLSIPITRVS